MNFQVDLLNSNNKSTCVNCYSKSALCSGICLSTFQPETKNNHCSIIDRINGTQLPRMTILQ